MTPSWLGKGVAVDRGAMYMERLDDDLWPADAVEPLGGPWPVIEVDTTRTVDVVELCTRIRQAAG
jgi:hypothetical protein